MDTSGLEKVKFGDEMRQKEFCLNPNLTFINNGSYGTVPRRVHEAQKRYLDKMESSPDQWFWTDAHKLWHESRHAVAEFVGADVDDVVFVVNATSGVNTVLRSLNLRAGDAIMMSSLTYGSLQLLWKDVADEKIRSKGVETLLMEIKLPIASEDDLVQRYDRFLGQHPNVKFVLIDHISSPSSILMPVRRLADVCHRHGAMVMVDGAHAPGQVQLNLRELGVDFYTGNMHKWGFTPRGCAILWISRQHHDHVAPPVTSWERGRPLSEQFYQQGTRDHTPFICAKHALEFYEAIGGVEKAMGYTRELATRARDMLMKEIGLKGLDIPSSMEAPNLRLLKLPGVPALCQGYTGLDKRKGIVKLQRKILEEDNIHAYFNWVEGCLYLRISVQVYNTIDDFHKMVPVLKRILDDLVPYDTQE